MIIDLRTKDAHPSFEMPGGEAWRVQNRLLFANSSVMMQLRREGHGHLQPLTDEQKELPQVREYMSGRPRTLIDALNETVKLNLQPERAERLAQRAVDNDNALLSYMDSNDQNTYYVTRRSN
jgi:hypothetical protein